MYRLMDRQQMAWQQTMAAGERRRRVMSGREKSSWTYECFQFICTMCALKSDIDGVSLVIAEAKTIHKIVRMGLIAANANGMIRRWQ